MGIGLPPVRPLSPAQNNEVYLDIVETINVLMTAKGTVLRADVSGKVLMKCLLTGMPELKIGLNDSAADGGDPGGAAGAGGYSGGAGGRAGVQLDDVAFHQCVDLVLCRACVPSRTHTGAWTWPGSAPKK